MISAGHFRAAVAAFLLTGSAGWAQSLTVLPVNIQMRPGEGATSLTVINQGNAVSAVQVRVYSWDQSTGTDQLVPSDRIHISPPLATINPGASQVIRLALRRPPEGREDTYRILVDQIPPPAEPGTVRIALRLSIPVFAQPKGRAVATVAYSIERAEGRNWLIARNNGGRHETVRDIQLVTEDGRTLSIERNVSPYLLAGATRRWQISGDHNALSGPSIRLKAITDAGPLDQSIKLPIMP